MCEGLPQVAIVTVHPGAHRHRRVSRQETSFYVDPFVHEGANRARCDGGGWAAAAPPPQPTFSTKTRTHEDGHTTQTLNRRLISEGETPESPQAHRVKGEGWNSHLGLKKCCVSTLLSEVIFHHSNTKSEAVSNA